MELTIDRALEQGINAHRKGNLGEADKFYTAILKTQPHHPDANHNMGRIALSLGKAREAFTFLRRAIEANPEIEQFWVSYIRAR